MFLRVYEKSSLKTTTSLALLNWGQNLIFSVGMAGIMALAANEIMKGEVLSPPPRRIKVN